MLCFLEDLDKAVNKSCQPEKPLEAGHHQNHTHDTRVNDLSETDQLPYRRSGRHSDACIRTSSKGQSSSTAMIVTGSNRCLLLTGLYPAEKRFPKDKDWEKVRTTWKGCPRSTSCGTDGRSHSRHLKGENPQARQGREPHSSREPRRMDEFFQ